MLTKVILNNWQCFPHLELELAPLTTLVGDNDSGKTAILRALEWVALNAWNAAAGEYITWGQKECSIRVHAEKRVIERRRVKDSNVYLLDGQELKAFRTDVPEQVQKALGLTPDNFQRQDEPPFWISLKSTEAASALNDIFNLSAIDEASTFLASELHKARTAVSVAEGLLAESIRTKDALDWTGQADKDLQEMEGLHHRLEEIALETSTITFDLERLRKGEEVERNYEGLIAQAEAAYKACLELHKAEKKIADFKVIRAKEEEIECLTKTLNRKAQELAKALKGTCPLCNRG